MRLALVFAVCIHGLVHLLGFATGFDLLTVQELTDPVSRLSGIFWLLTTLLFLIVALGILIQKKWWWILAVVAIILSQVLIIGHWQDAKFGTLLNALILCAAIVGFAQWNFYRRYIADVQMALSLANPAEPDLILDTDLDRLPFPVQKYLRYVGVVNTPRLKNVKIEFEGEMRGRGKDWFSFRSEQYNTFESPHRLFFMTGNMKGFNVPGYHAYKSGTATMDIRLFSLIPVARNKGREMDVAETVTFFNDMCIMAPAALLDPRLGWEEIDKQTVRGIFSCNGITISATLFFDEEGRLINFVSDDRVDMSGKEPVRLRFSTPMSNYRDINGIHVPAYGEAIWHYPEGDFVYGKFYLRSIQYNVNAFGP